MSNAISRIGNALGYDAPESMLAHGVSLADVYKFAATAAELADVDADVAPVSHRNTMPAETARPGR